MGATVFDFVDLFVFIGLLFIDRSSKYFKIVEHPVFVTFKELLLGLFEALLLFYGPFGEVGNVGLAVTVYCLKLVGNFFLFGIVGSFWLSSVTCRPDWEFGERFDEAWKNDCCINCWGFDTQFRWFMMFWNFTLSFLGLIGTILIATRDSSDVGTIILLVVGLLEVILSTIELIWACHKQCLKKVPITSGITTPQPMEMIPSNNP